MTDYDFDILKLAHQGYCCSQIILHMALDLQGTSNPGLIRAMTGLCHGEMGTGGPCGAVSGAACLISYYGGKGSEMESMNERLPLMLSELNDWFSQYTGKRYGGINCKDIISDDEPDPAICGSLVSQCYGQAMTILTRYGYDPASGIDD